MLARIFSTCVSGAESVKVDVEVQLRSGQPKVTIIGLGGSAIKESKDRIPAALCQCGFDPPDQILVNLAPAEVRKEGSSFDVAIAVAVLVAQGVINRAAVEGLFVVGELSLDGSIKPIQGAISAAVEVLRHRGRALIIPLSNVREASLVQGVHIVGVRSLPELIEILRSGSLPQSSQVAVEKFSEVALDLADVRGQAVAKRALIVAAAGGHNMLMVGPPGCGKSMLAQRLSGLLPLLPREEQLEVACLWNAAQMPIHSILSGVRPFRAPHHVVSDAGLIGGGVGPRPGEVTLAHRGILFLDEFPEYRRSTLEALRLPLETGEVQIARARGSATFPARFQLVAAMNPCPCGRLGSSREPCRCSRNAVLGYLSRLSEPVLDRIDMHVELDPVSLDSLQVDGVVDEKYRTAIIRPKVGLTRDLQEKRQKKLNSRLELDELRKLLAATEKGADAALEGARGLGMSARGYVKVLRVARTIADIDGHESVTEDHVCEALSYRTLERLKRYVGMGGGAQSSRR